MCTPFTISHTVYIIGFLGLITILGAWVIHQISSAFSLKLDYRRINQETVEEQYPVLKKVLAEESADSPLQVRLANAHQLYLDANTILNGPNVWTQKHHSGHKAWKLFRRHDDADNYLSKATTLLAELQCLLAARAAGYSIAGS